MKPNKLFTLLNKIPVVGLFVGAAKTLLSGGFHPVAEPTPYLSEIRDELFSLNDPNQFATPAKLNAAIQKVEQMFASEDFAQADKFFRWLAHTCAGGFYQQRYFLDDVDADLNQALKHWQAVIDSEHTFDAERISGLTLFSRGLLARYERDGNLADLRQAISNFRDVLKMSPNLEELRRSGYADLAIALAMHAKATQNRRDCDEAIVWAHKHQLAPLADESDSDTAYADNLVIAWVFSLCYETHKNADDLAAAICLLEGVLAQPNLDNESHTSAQEGLGRCLRERFLRDAAQQDLLRATELATAALHNTSGSGGRLARRLNLVGLCLQLKGDREGAIDHLRRASGVVRMKSPYRPRYEQDLQAASRSTS